MPDRTDDSYGNIRVTISCDGREGEYEVVIIFALRAYVCCFGDEFQFIIFVAFKVYEVYTVNSGNAHGLVGIVYGLISDIVKVVYIIWIIHMLYNKLVIFFFGCICGDDFGSIVEITCFTDGDGMEIIRNENKQLIVFKGCDNTFDVFVV